MASVLDDVVAGRTPRMPYEETLRLPRAEGWEPGRVWCSWRVDPEVMQPWGGVFGEYLALLADQFAGLATLSVLDEGEQFALGGDAAHRVGVVHGGHGGAREVIHPVKERLVEGDRHITRLPGRLLATQHTTRFLKTRLQLVRRVRMLFFDAVKLPCGAITLALQCAGGF